MDFNDNRAARPTQTSHLVCLSNCKASPEVGVEGSWGQGSGWVSPRGSRVPRAGFHALTSPTAPNVVTYQSWFISWEASPNTDNWPLETGFGVNEILVLAPLTSSVLADKTVAGKPD